MFIKFLAALTIMSLQASPQLIQSDLQRAIVIDPIQPDETVIERLEHRPTISARDEGTFKTDGLPYQGSAMVENYVPYYPYYALKEGSNRVIHPMAWGRFLLRNSKAESCAELVAAATNTASVLPNGGLAWYYPRYYDVSRMRGDQLKYSSISQGTILSGLMAMAQDCPQVTEAIARSAYKAMEWPFENGGINLADRAVLEMPSFAGPPEIILNGWIDAILHMRDYAAVTEDDDAWSFFERNIAFLVEVLPNFDAREVSISRYSDASPYRVKVELADAADVDSLQ
ncbi:MAG: D-glucuronyl C5-epimerase family protein, partial [Parvularcula sp.]|nr:D-glucuronyl C5-epimerase family protein [Parvularcula sp.]